MKIVISFVDGNQLELCDSSIINGYVNINKETNKYELKKAFSTSFMELHNKVTSLLNYNVPQLGYAGLINEMDWISIGDNTDFSTFYKTSSIKSISRKLM